MKKGDKVRTKKGCRINGPFEGIVLGFSTGYSYRFGVMPTAKIKKTTNIHQKEIVYCFVHNLEVIDWLKSEHQKIEEGG